MSFDPLVSLLVAVVVLLIGTAVNRKVAILSKYNIPDPITGGLLFAAVASVAWAMTDFRVAVSAANARLGLSIPLHIAAAKGLDGLSKPAGATPPSAPAATPPPAGK